jgi:malic enzyme
MVASAHSSAHPPVSGYALLNHPQYNKDQAFTLDERLRYGLTGLLPHAEMNIQEQVASELAKVRGKNNDLERYIGLMALQDRNETLFYRLLVEHIEELMPIVYTPTVGLACQHYSHILRRPRGIWLTPNDRGNMHHVLKNVPQKHVRLMVVTDNERILGLGDQGCGGMAISIGKLTLYTAGAGIHPSMTLPISLDVGTNNAELLQDKRYLGYRAERLTGNDYRHFIEEFVEAVHSTFPHALLQWEDFYRDAALENLQRYRQRITSFNDDIQGTAGVALAGILTYHRHLQKNWEDTRILLVGAGSAGAGIGELIRLAMQKWGLDESTIRRHLVFTDSRGLLIEGREHLPSDPQNLLVMPTEVAQSYGIHASDNLRDLTTLIRKIKPTVLLGTAAQPQIFTEPMLKAMSETCERPLIMPFSNPTSKAECTPEQAIHWTQGKALLATGSPFPAVDYAGQRHRSAQGNNVFIFPGVGLGCILAKVRTVTDDIFLVAAKTLSEMVDSKRFAEGAIYPEVSALREVSKNIATQVVTFASQNHLGKHFQSQKIDDYVAKNMWFPDYIPYI